MKLPSLLLFMLIVSRALALEPLAPSPPIPISSGTYLLVTQGRLNDQARSLMQQNTVIIALSRNGKLVLREAEDKETEIEQDADSFAIVRKQRGSDGSITITTYLGSLSTNEPVSYAGNFVSIGRADQYTTFDEGSFFLIRQKPEEK